MRRIAVSILAVFYLCSSTGANVHMHYCMGKLINWSLANEGEKCAKCGMKKDGGCCKDENKFVKNNFDQKTAESALQFMQCLTAATPVSLINISESYLSSLIEENPICHAPPLISAGEIYILNCVFRI